MGTQQARFDAWRAEFNDVRPHEALGGEVPGSVYTPSVRPMPATLPEPDYPAHFEARFVSRCGAFKFKRRQIFLSQALSQEWIAFEEVADGIWSLYFYEVLLGRLDERDFKLQT